MPNGLDVELPDPPEPIAIAATGVAAFVGWFADGTPGQPVRVTGPDEATEQLGPAAAGGEAARALRAFFANGGACAWAVPVSGDGDALDAAALVGAAGAGTGLDALAGLDEVDLVCLPDACHLDERAAGEVYRAAAEVCEERRTFLLVDLPLAVRSAVAILAWVADQRLRYRNAALYVPRLVVADAASPGATRTVPASGAVAGVIARSDALQGVWKAPAGVDAALQDVVRVETGLTRQDQERLNQGGVNVVRRLPDLGHVVWGARTLAGDGSDREWTYVSVRRTALLVERSLEHGLQWVASEPDTEPTWASVRRLVEDLLHRLWRNGALQGQTPDRAYFVRCGLGQTMTAADVEDGVLVVELGLALVRPAEFTVLRQRFATADGTQADGGAGADHLDVQDLPGDLRVDRLHLDDLERARVRDAAERIGRDRRAGAAKRLLLVVRDDGADATAVVRAIAGELGVDVLRIDLGAVVSRYIGETEKNLGRLLDRAADTGVVLLLDEADALFGRRSEVKDAHDRYANLEASLLRRVADHPGVVVIAVADAQVLRRRVEVDEVLTIGAGRAAGRPTPGLRRLTDRLPEALRSWRRGRRASGGAGRGARPHRG